MNFILRHDADPGRLALGDLQPLVEGGTRRIFLRPGKEGQLVKLPGELRYIKLRRRRNPLVHWKLRLRATRYRYIIREYAAYWEAMLRAEELDAVPPIAHQRGLALTEAGIGQLVQKIRDREGRPAPSLRELASRDGLDDAAIEALGAFAAEIYRFRIVAHDLTAKNIVYETRHGRNRFVMIDGFGDHTLIPVRRWSRWLNERKLDRDFDRMARRLGLRWHHETRSFTRAH